MLDPMKEHMEDLNVLDAPEPSPPATLIAKLRDRISDLEEENANLRGLDEVIRRNARLFDAVLRHSRDGFFLITPRMTFLRVIHSVLGNTDQNLTGQPVLSIVHPEDRTAMATAFATLLNDPSRSATCECRAQDQRGHWCWLEVEMTDLLNDPDVQAIVFTNRKITERRS
jgi:PAS domain S-box-containing protein